MIRSNLRLIWDAKVNREGNKLSYTALAKKTGVSKATLQRLADTEKPIERIEGSTAYALCSFFGCSLGEMFEFIPDRKQG